MEGHSQSVWVCGWEERSVQVVSWVQSRGVRVAVGSSICKYSMHMMNASSFLRWYLDSYISVEAARRFIGRGGTCVEVKKRKLPL